MAAPPFKVKASYEYNSPHDDDLSFPQGQIITVTEEEDVDWYVGEYSDESGTLQSGLFPRNFVERYEPAPPPRPVRSTRKQTSQPPPEQAVEQPEQPPQALVPVQQQPAPSAPVAAPAQLSSPVDETAPPLPAAQPAPKSTPAKAPPPVAEKSASFKDRIAAFNKASGPPVTPFKPGALATGGFVKKPFIAPPPSRSAYVPLPPESTRKVVYKRDEDPEIAERQAQDRESAEKAGLVPTSAEGEEEAPKAVSLKERIALLQKQQQEQASRRAEVSSKEKPRRPPKKRSESEQDAADEREPQDLGIQMTQEPGEHQEQPRRTPRIPPTADVQASDGNEADQSAADETAEEPEGASSEEEEQPHAAAPADAEEEEEEAEEEVDEMDEDARHQLALRERMAKLSGGMGMTGMFGVPGAMPMPGMRSNSVKKVPARSPVDDDDAVSPPPAPRVPIPGLNRTPSHPPDAEDPRFPKDHSTLPADAGEPASVDRGSSEAARPPPPPPAAVRSPSPGSESDDEMPPHDLSESTASPPVAPRPVPPPPERQASYAQETPVREKRTSRGPPPLPPTSPSQSRAPPPLPSVPRRPTISENNVATAPIADVESEYEGDYDTDIASGEKHKDALKQGRESGMLDSSFTDDASARPPPPVPAIPPVPYSAASRPPPPPPSQPPLTRSPVESPYFVPPPIPRDSPRADLDDYDPFNYGPAAARPAVRQRGSLSSQHAPPPIPTSMPSLPGKDEEYQPKTGSPRLPRQSGDVERPLPIRRSVEQPRASLDHGFIAKEVDLAEPSQWWAQPNLPPPVFQGSNDLLFEIEESTTTKRGGKTTISKDVYVLFHDYSQTIISAVFDARQPADVALEQRNEPPPAQLRQDQLEEVYGKFGAHVAQAVAGKQNITVGDGSPGALVTDLLAPLENALPPVGARAYGPIVYKNLANASVQQFDEIRPGDIVTFRSAKFQGKHGGVMHQKYQMEAGNPDHVGVVVEWDGTKKKLRAIEQGRDSKKAKVESFRLGDLRSGEVKVHRLVGRDWVGWA